METVFFSLGWGKHTIFEAFCSSLLLSYFTKQRADEPPPPSRSLSKLCKLIKYSVLRCTSVSCHAQTSFTTFACVWKRFLTDTFSTFEKYSVKLQTAFQPRSFPQTCSPSHLHLRSHESHWRSRICINLCSRFFHCNNIKWQTAVVFVRHSAEARVFKTGCFVVLQVVETNLVAFDCHWILINEVSALAAIYESYTLCALCWPSFFIFILWIFLTIDPKPLCCLPCLGYSRENLVLFVSHHFLQTHTHTRNWCVTFKSWQLVLLQCLFWMNNCRQAQTVHKVNVLLLRVYSYHHVYFSHPCSWSLIRVSAGHKWNLMKL